MPRAARKLRTPSARVPRLRIARSHPRRQKVRTSCPCGSTLGRECVEGLAPRLGVHGRGLGQDAVHVKTTHASYAPKFTARVRRRLEILRPSR